MIISLHEVELVLVFLHPIVVQWYVLYVQKLLLLLKLLIAVLCHVDYAGDC